MTCTKPTVALLLLLGSLSTLAGPIAAEPASSCDGEVPVRASIAGSALILSEGTLQNLRYGRELMVDEHGRMTARGRRIAYDPRLLSPFARTIDQQRNHCAPSTFKSRNEPEACGGNNDWCCDNTGDLEEILCLADLIFVCSGSNCTLLPASGSQGPVCVCTN